MDNSTENPYFDKNSYKKINNKILNENSFNELNKNYLISNNYKQEIINTIDPFTNSIINKKISINYNPNLLTPQTLPKGGLRLNLETYATITAENIAEYAYPLAQFIDQVRPDYIIACDRGARMIAIATHMLYGELYGNLPTQDHAIRFRKISRKVDEVVVKKTLKEDIDHMLAHVDEPTVLVLDDWVSSGQTQELVRNIFHEYSHGKVKVLYGVMTGGNADATGKLSGVGFPDWHDNVDIIGVDYNDELKPYKVESKQAINYRRRMSRNIKQFAARLKANQITQ